MQFLSLGVKSMLSAGPSWQGNAQQTLRNARAEFNLQKLADKMFRRQGEVRERRRYKRLYELNYDKNLPRVPGDDNPIGTIMRPRFNGLSPSYLPGWERMFAAMYPTMRSIDPYVPGFLRMRDVVRRTMLRLRVWIRRTLRRLVCTRDGQRFFLPLPRELNA
jgi:hypothetical protein